MSHAPALRRLGRCRALVKRPPTKIKLVMDSQTAKALGLMWGQTPVRQDPEGHPMAATGADRGGGRGEPGQAQRPARPLPSGATAARPFSFYF
jgi:hypothetical protein